MAEISQPCQRPHVNGHLLIMNFDTIFSSFYPADTRRWTNLDSILGQRRRRRNPHWVNVLWTLLSLLARLRKRITNALGDLRIVEYFY